MTSLDVTQVYRDTTRREWRWRRVSPNGKIIATSGEGYKSKWWAKRQAKRLNPGTRVVVLDVS